MMTEGGALYLDFAVSRGHKISRQVLHFGRPSVRPVQRGLPSSSRSISVYFTEL